ncbi:hypothetical protein HNR19_003449 [Nocardioides thalensis]|uniref:FHA domain-containing protein n=1 Tax=Nocardioides thalensis TaxID=1914755 RepID=A0A853C6H2_9ACTN|nr:hypothetical protein [Nocardioides thalensis]NYJ02751.1 hypothetical protein [Nocardioides thalensis]
MSDTTTGPGTAAWSYRAGPWFAVFGPQVTVLLPQSERDRVIDLWSLVDGGGGFDEVLDGLLASGLSKLPGFVLVGASEGPTHVLLRGSGVTATLTAGGEEVVLDGGAGATWTERSLDDVTALRIEVPAEDGEPVADADFPVTTGLVRVGRVDRPAAVAAPASAAEAAPAAAAAVPEAETAEPVAGISDHSLIGDDGAAPVVVPAGDTHPDGSERLEELTPAEVSGGEGAPFEAADEAPVDEAPVDEAPVDDAPVDETPADEAPAESPYEEPAVDAEAAVDESAEPGEMSPFDELAPGTSPNEPMPADDGADLLPTDVMPAVGGDPLTDPLPDTPDAPAEPAAAPSGEAPSWEPAGAPAPPSEPAPDGWVTPYDSPAGVDDTVPPPVAPDLPPAPEAPGAEVAPPAWTPPPPPAVPDAPADTPPPPLGIGSWEPVTGAVPTAGGYPPPPPPAADPDHDGLTVAGGQAAPPLPAQPSEPAAPAGAAPVAKLLISDGQTIMVDRVVLIGRAPEARRFSSTEQPLLVTVPSRLHEISSTHVEVRPGGGPDLGTAVVTDMGSTNGTVLVQPGLGPEDLKPGIAVQLIPGAIINLGDGITIQVTRP